MHPEASFGRSRALDTLGHHATAVLSVLIVAVVVVGLMPPPGVLAFTIPVTLFAVVIAVFLVMRQHDRSLCERCLLDTPLDAAGRATKMSRRFWMAHTGSEPQFLVPYFAVLIGSNFSTTETGRYAWALVQLSMIYLLMSNATHRRLQPWCPWCSSGGGGEEIDETPPVLPHDDRQLT